MVLSKTAAFWVLVFLFLVFLLGFSLQKEKIKNKLKNQERNQVTPWEGMS